MAGNSWRGYANAYASVSFLRDAERERLIGGYAYATINQITLAATLPNAVSKRVVNFEGRCLLFGAVTLNDSLSVALWVTLWLLKSCFQKLVELVRLPNGFGEYRRQCPSTENATQTIRIYEIFTSCGAEYM